MNAWTEPVLLATKDRVPLPVSVRKMIKIACPGRLVADMATDGSAALLTEAEFAPMRERMMSQIGEQPKAALAALDRYQAVPVTAECRLVLSTALRSHLEALDSAIIRLVVEDGRLTLWSEKAWKCGRPARLAMIA